MTLDDPIATHAATAAEAYGADYYATHCGPLPYARGTEAFLRFFGGVAEEIVRSLAPRRVFDAGCALGFLVEALWDRGVEARGRDISTFAISQVRADMRPFCEVGSIADPIEGGHDLVTCIEVLEHMPEGEALRAIAAMAAAAPRILFSSSPVDLDEPTHLTVRPTLWWLRRFAGHGFSPVASFDASFVAPHAMLLERRAEPPGDEALAAFAALIRLRLALAERDRRLSDQERRAAEAEARAAEAEARRSALASETAGARLAASRAAQAAAEASTRLVAIEMSTAWRMTAPLRHALAGRPRARRLLHGVARLAWWTGFGQVLARLGEGRGGAALAAPETAAPAATPVAARAAPVPEPHGEPVDIVARVHNARPRTSAPASTACSPPPCRPTG